MPPERFQTSRRMASGGSVRLVSTTLAVAGCAPLVGRAAPPGRAPSVLIWPVEQARVEDRLPGAVGAARVHRVRGVAQQRHRPKVQRGSGSRSTIGYSRIFSVAADHAGTSSQSKCQSAKAGMKSSSLPARFQSWRTRLGPTDLGDPVDQLLAASRRPRGSGRSPSCRVEPAGPDHVAPARKGWSARHAAPHVDAGVRRAFVRDRAAAHRRVDAVAADRDAAAREAAPSSNAARRRRVLVERATQRCPSRTASSPSRSRTASSRTSCRSARGSRAAASRSRRAAARLADR